MNTEVELLTRYQLPLFSIEDKLTILDFQYYIKMLMDRQNAQSQANDRPSESVASLPSGLK